MRGRAPQTLGANEHYIVMVRGNYMLKYAPKHNLRKSRVGKEYEVEGDQYYGRMLEIGTEKVRPHPWLAPAYFASREKACATVIEELSKGVNRAIAKVSRGR